MKILGTLTLVSLMWFPAFGAKNTTDLVELQKVLNKIQQSPLVEFKTKRTVTSEMMGTETLYEGQLSISKKLFRWDHDVPEKNMILFDGKTFWSVSYPAGNDSGRVSVSKSTQTKMIEQQSGLSLFFGNSKIGNTFKVGKAIQENDLKTLELKAVKENPQFRNLKVTYQVKKRELTKIQFEDEIGNVTLVEFKETIFKNKPNSKLFKYVPPKGTQVTEL